jgi:hypothetical protein
MQQFIQAMGAASSWTLQSGGDYFRLVSCPSPVDVKFFRQGHEIASATQMDTGFYLKPAGGFDRVDIATTAAQTVKIMVLDGDGGYDHFNVDFSGAAAVNVQQAAAVNDLAAVVVGVAATVLVAASATRKGLRFTNAGTVDVYLGGAGVTVAGGAIKIGAGQTWIEDQAAPAAWYGIAGTAAQSVKIQEIV